MGSRLWKRWSPRSPRLRKSSTSPAHQNEGVGRGATLTLGENGHQVRQKKTVQNHLGFFHFYRQQAKSKYVHWWSLIGKKEKESKLYNFYIRLSRWWCKGRAWWLGSLPWSVESHPEEVEEEKGSISNKSQGAIKSIKWWIRGRGPETFNVIHQGQAPFQTPEEGQATHFQTQCRASGTQKQSGQRWVNFRCEHQHKFIPVRLFTMR